jgi:hypothetical protein
MQKESEVTMPKKRCPKCEEIKEQVNRVFSVISNWDKIEDDYRYDSEDLYNAELIDKCLECDIELEELPDDETATREGS